MTSVYVLHCSVSAKVRQSVQIAFKDYKLPDDVIDTLKAANALSIRPNLSNALKKALDELRLKQRYLYDRCTIHHGDVHFLHEDHFEEAVERIKELREHAKLCNERIQALWADELNLWSRTVDNFFSPLFADQTKLALVREAYLKTFPTKEEFKAPIQVSVVGPYPALMETVTEPITLSDQINNAAALNTGEVLKAAQQGARDNSYSKIAELLDDLDSRSATKVGDRVLSDNPRKRGAWQIAHSELSLAATHNPALKTIAKLVGDLVQCGRRMQNAPKGAERMKQYSLYSEIREDIRTEAAELAKAADSTKGFESLQMSLSLSNRYQDLINGIDTCDNLSDLAHLREEVTSQTEVFKHRARKLEQLFSLAQEKLVARSHVAATAKELESQTFNNTNDCDF